MSEWDAEAAERRDFRNAKSGPEVIGHRRKRDNTACKKSPDRMHTFERQLSEFPEWNWWTPPLACVFCGRIEF